MELRPQHQQGKAAAAAFPESEEQPTSSDSPMYLSPRKPSPLLPFTQHSKGICRSYRSLTSNESMNHGEGCDGKSRQQKQQQRWKVSKKKKLNPSDPPLRSRLKERWALGHQSGSKRETGGVNPLRLARAIRDRMVAVLSDYVKRYLEGDQDAEIMVKKATGVSLSGVKSSIQCERVASEDLWIKLSGCFDNFMKSLHKESQKNYDSKRYCGVKWINCIPTFQVRFGVSAFQIEPFIAVTTDLKQLKGLYNYFYLLYLDSHCYRKCYFKWARLFPNKCEFVRRNGVELATLDVYEETL